MATPTISRIVVYRHTAAAGVAGLRFALVIRIATPDAPSGQHATADLLVLGEGAEGTFRVLDAARNQVANPTTLAVGQWTMV